MPTWECKNLCKRYGSVQALDDVSFTVEPGRVVGLLGPNGSGKTTFLSCLTGAYGVDSGSILLDGEKVDLKKRNIAYIMQEYSTLPWLTVRQNVAFGLTIKKRPRKEAREKVEEVMEKVGLTAFADMYPRQLSASMLQRVSIARAFAVEPELLLMDEPYGQLDIDLRFKLEDELLRLWKASGTTVIFITHNIEEAVYLSQRILILTNKPTSIKDEIPVNLPHPRDVAAADFVALRNRVTEEIKWW